MDALHQPVPSNEDRCRPRVEIDSLWNLLPHFRGRTRNQIGVLNSVLLHESPFAFQASLLLRFFKVEGNYSQALVAILLVELDQILCLIMAIGAPCSCHDGEYKLTLEARKIGRESWRDR